MRSHGPARVAPPDPAAGSAGWVLGVQGASGGVGASTLTVATAGRATACRLSVVAVDACPWGGGLDLRAGLECEPGARWPDLSRLRAPQGAALLAELPQEDGLAVLSWRQGPPVAGPTEPWLVAAALRTCVDVVVVDLPPLGAPDGARWRAACDDVVLVVGAGLDCLPPAMVAVETVGELSGVVLRRAGSGMDADLVGDGLGLPVLAEVDTEASVRSDLLRGRPVGGHGSLAAAGERVLAALLPRLKDAD